MLNQMFSYYLDACISYTDFNIWNMSWIFLPINSALNSLYKVDFGHGENVHTCFLVLLLNFFIYFVMVSLLLVIGQVLFLFKYNQLQCLSCYKHFFFLSLSGTLIFAAIYFSFTALNLLNFLYSCMVLQIEYSILIFSLFTYT